MVCLMPCSPNKNISTLFQASSHMNIIFNGTSVISVYSSRIHITSNDRVIIFQKQARLCDYQPGIGNHITVMPAIRLDYTENSGTELVPQVNISYKINNIQLRGSAGKTIRRQILLA